MLSRIRASQPPLQPLPDRFKFTSTFADLTDQFADVLASVGGTAVRVSDWNAITDHLREQYAGVTNVATTLPELAHVADFDLNVATGHALADLNLAIIGGQLAVAENAAIWVDELDLFQPGVPLRVLPMITQYLAIVIRQSTLVANLHDAYARLTVDQTGFGTFICGPSKTADIEQSLVIGAHGARSLTVYVLMDGQAVSGS